MARVIQTGITDEAVIRKQLEAEGYFNIFRWCDAKGREYPTHTHPHDEVRWILSGVLLIEEEGKILKLRPGDRMQSQKGTPHSARAMEEVCYICASR